MLYNFCSPAFSGFISSFENNGFEFFRFLVWRDWRGELTYFEEGCLLVRAVQDLNEHLLFYFFVDTPIKFEKGLHCHFGNIWYQIK